MDKMMKKRLMAVLLVGVGAGVGIFAGSMLGWSLYRRESRAHALADALTYAFGVICVVAYFSRSAGQLKVIIAGLGASKGKRFRAFVRAFLPAFLAVFAVMLGWVFSIGFFSLREAWGSPWFDVVDGIWDGAYIPVMALLGLRLFLGTAKAAGEPAPAQARSTPESEVRQ